MPTAQIDAHALLPFLNVALKEWASVCSALAEGRQILLLRKGGIWETHGKFEPKHRHFLLFPTYVHQNLNMLKASEHADFESMAQEPASVTLRAAGVVSDVVQLTGRKQMDALEDQHVWTPPLIDMRFNYRPDNPLYLMLVRAYRLASPITLENTPAYAGCKSWVPLEQSLVTAGAVAMLDDATYAARCATILDRLASVR